MSKDSIPAFIKPTHIHIHKPTGREERIVMNKLKKKKNKKKETIKTNKF